MKYNPQYHHRRSIRLPNYNYSRSGMYFITICAYQKQCLFGEIKQKKMFLNQIGKIVREEWLRSVEIRQEIEFDEWVIMPNHIHGIVIIQNNDLLNIDREGAMIYEGASLAPLRRKPRSLSSFVVGFKSSVTKRIKVFCSESLPRIWQRNDYESIVRNEEHLNQIRQYILNNPQKWLEDIEKPQNDNGEFQINFIF